MTLITQPANIRWSKDYVPPPLWTPANITTALWLDASDASTVTTVSGAVSQWNDKSGNGRNATQGTAANRPAYTAGAQNGNGILSFDGSNDFLGIASTALFSSGNADMTIIAAYKSKHAIGSEYSAYGTLIANFNVGDFAVYFGGLTAASYILPWGIYNKPEVIDIDSGTYTQNQNWIIGAVRSSGSWTGWTNGTQKNTVADSGSVYADSGTSSVWRIGANTLGTEPANMDLYELVCINSAITSANRERMEGYLAHKWGLAGSLPSGHPYKSAAPRQIDW